MAVDSYRVTVFLPKNLCGFIRRTASGRQPHECIWLYGSWNRGLKVACVTSYSVDRAPEPPVDHTETSPGLLQDPEEETALIGVVHTGDDDNAVRVTQPQLAQEIQIFNIRSARLVARAQTHPLYVIFYEPEDFLSPCCYAEDLGRESGLAFVAKVCRATTRAQQEGFAEAVINKTWVEAIFSMVPAQTLCGKAIRFRTCEGILHRLWSSVFCPAVFVSLASKSKLAEEPAAPFLEKDRPNQRLLGLRRKTVAYQLWADMILGVVCLVLLLRNREMIVRTMSGLTEVVVGGLYQLLEWMMGAPAGLKLNRQLDVFLGKFFSYHVWLWAGYLDYQSNHMHSLINVLAAAGILGASTQIAIARDLLALSTMHLYCFYVYMARLYYVQVTALQSFWRLFRGKKWNSLRLRVDTAAYDVQQLFIGTLLLAVVFFLLPTVALYYVVFVVFRVAVCCIQSSLTFVGDILESCYWYILLLKLSKSSSLVGGTADYKLCRDYHTEDSHVLYLQMKLKQVPYALLCQLLYLKQPPVPSPSWTGMMKSIVLGHLI